MRRFTLLFNKTRVTSAVEQNLLTQKDDVPIRKSPFQRFRSSLRRSILTWMLSIISLVVVTITVWLAWRIANVEIYFDTFTNYTADLKLLRILAEVNTVLLTTLTAMSSRAAIWAASRSRRGVSMSTWLAMSPATGMLGLINLYWWRQQNNREARDWHRFCCVIRLRRFLPVTYIRISLHIGLPVISVLLTSKIRVSIVSDSSFCPCNVPLDAILVSPIQFFRDWGLRVAR
jgi:hypothetical protein